MIKSINDFIRLSLKGKYSRDDLARAWGYSNLNAFRRGIFTPQNTNIIVLFVTENKSEDATQYKDEMVNGFLYLEGEEKHSNDARIMKNLMVSQDIFLLFYRENNRELFTFYGEVKLINAQEYINEPSKYLFKVMP